MIWLLPCLFLWTSFLLSMITLRLPDPHQDAHRKSILWVQACIGILFLYLQIATLTVAVEAKTSMALAFVIGGFGLFMIALGWSFKTCKRNNLIGIRTKWTLASEENWDKTHRFASSVFNVGGAFLAIFPYFLNLMIAAGVLLAAVLATIIYSYRQRPG
jgi:uncharacterized membrane protein